MNTTPADVEATIDQLNRKKIKWTYMSIELKVAIGRYFIAQFAADGRTTLGSVEFNKSTPDWMPKIQSLFRKSVSGLSWTSVLAEFGMRPPVKNKSGLREKDHSCECGRPTITKRIVINNSPSGVPSYSSTLLVCAECAAQIDADNEALRNRGLILWTAQESKSHRQLGKAAA